MEGLKPASAMHMGGAGSMLSGGLWSEPLEAELYLGVGVGCSRVPLQGRVDVRHAV